jgi:hypothetical protein
MLSGHLFSKLNREVPRVIKLYSGEIIKFFNKQKHQVDYLQNFLRIVFFHNFS